MCFIKYSPAEIEEEIKEERANFYERLGKGIGIGQPSKPVALKQEWNMKEVLTIVYIVVDDIYKKLFGSQRYFRNSANGEPKFTDSEVITLAIVGELRS